MRRRTRTRTERGGTPTIPLASALPLAVALIVACIWTTGCNLSPREVAETESTGTGDTQLTQDSRDTYAPASPRTESDDAGVGTSSVTTADDDGDTQAQADDDATVTGPVSEDGAEASREAPQSGEGLSGSDAQDPEQAAADASPFSPSDLPAVALVPGASDEDLVRQGIADYLSSHYPGERLELASVIGLGTTMSEGAETDDIHWASYLVTFVSRRQVGLRVTASAQTAPYVSESDMLPVSGDMFYVVGDARYVLMSAQTDEADADIVAQYMLSHSG